MRKLIPTIILTAILTSFVIEDHREREALTPATDQLTPATYRGLLPAADCSGIDYTLTLNDSLAGADTLYDLRMVYIDGDGAGRDVTFESRGRQQLFSLGAQRGYRLTSNEGDPDTYFVITNDSTLTMCDSTLTAPQSALNYDLVRVSE